MDHGTQLSVTLADAFHHHCLLMNSDLSWKDKDRTVQLGFALGQTLHLDVKLSRMKTYLKWFHSSVDLQCHEFDAFKRILLFLAGLFLHCIT